jgi:hypothetical protein
MKKKPTNRKIKVKKDLNLPKVIKTKTSGKKPKNAKEYYKCMNACCKGKNITQVARECKTNALAINAQISAQKAKAVKTIKEGYDQLGKGLTEFIKAH